MLNFLFYVIAAGVKPLSLAAGVFVGYLFHKDWKQLAWGLLLFVIPGIGGLDASTDSHGVLYRTGAEFVAICLVASGSFWIMEYFVTRRRVSKPEA